MKKLFSLPFLGLLVMVLFGLSMLAGMVAVFGAPPDGFQVVKDFSNCKFSFGSLEGFYAFKGMIGNETALAITTMVGVKKLSLDKGIYDEAKTTGKTFSEILEKDDPSENYKGSNLEKLDAYERQLAAHDIQVKGKQAALVGDFYKTDTSKILFPEFINRNLKIGMNRGKMEAMIDDVVSTTSEIDSNSLKGISVDMNSSNVEYKRVNENAKFPLVVFKTKEQANTLYKIGTSINATYEALRRVKVDLIANALQIIGFNLSRAMVYEVLDVLLNGDGNSNPAPEVLSVGHGDITFEDILSLELEFENFENEFLIGNKNTMKKVLKIPEFRDPLIASKFLTNGDLQTPFGNTLKLNKKLPDSKLIGFNRKAGVEMLEEKGASLVETGKIINQQFEEIVISKYCGFSKIFPDSAFVLNFA